MLRVIKIQNDVLDVLNSRRTPAHKCEQLRKYYGEDLRMNQSTGHIIFYSIGVPKVVGLRDTEVVIGIRPTEFEPYVAWLAMDGVDYAYGDYCQTLQGAIDCAEKKLERELRV